MDRSRFSIVTGLYRSASTWMFNAAREVFLSHGVDALHVYSDHLIKEIRDARERSVSGVIKTHCPDEELMEFISASDHAIMLTIRDPLDCISSFVLQFHAPFEFALDMVTASAGRAVALNSKHRVALFRYEDQPFKKVATITKLSELIGAPCTIGAAIEIFNGLKVGAVRDRIDFLVEAGVLDPSRPMESCDVRTHWHPNHIGDGLVGKYRSHLSDDEIEKVVVRNEDFYSTFYGGRPSLGVEGGAAGVHLA